LPFWQKPGSKNAKIKYQKSKCNAKCKKLATRKKTSAKRQPVEKSKT